ncbi:hypothetical protein BP6252_04587 [Coleophoma cylindrospora]|uniref:SGNH hydrolase-type esterase domain-containing protein n=1 Tax=Coleophoma cylindrospora TaxID=1849047 RepID=A0A3D8S0X9_9HELO|nr:hypothetical protein BP6252_04587 [Coleophoma cylindrospora]
MEDQSTSCTPTSDPARIYIVEMDESLPWNQHLSDQLSDPIDSPKKRRGFKCSLRRLLAFSVALIILSWLYMVHDRYRTVNVTPFVHQRPNLDGLKFVPSDNPYIHASVPVQDRAMLTSSRVYFDFVVNGSKTILISLHNTKSQSSEFLAEKPLPEFLRPSNTTSTSAPVSILARVGDEDYLVFPEASSITDIRRNLDVTSRQDIRIVAPMNGGFETLELDGLWIDEKSQILPQSQTQTGNGGEHPRQRKILEIVTDLSGASTARQADTKKTAQALLRGVRGWEYLLGEMFGADHTSHSGPPESKQFLEPWHFSPTVPDVMVLNLGNSDWESFEQHQGEYDNLTSSAFNTRFEKTYISLLKAIRTLAYPSGAIDRPIFVMRPFRGQLEQSTRSVVEHMRLQGDRFIFWLDTSGWLNPAVDSEQKSEGQDFYIDEASPLKQRRLTERGHQRVAMLLHKHVCKYLARDTAKCVVLPADTYHSETWIADVEHVDASKSELGGRWDGRRSE